MWDINKKASLEQIYCFLEQIEEAFVPILSKRVDLKDYAMKLYSKGYFFGLIVDNEIVSGLFYYLNEEQNEVYISILGTITSYQKKGLISNLLDEFEKEIRVSGIKKVRLETWIDNHALFMYLKKGFCVESVVDDRGVDAKSVKLFKLYKDFIPLEFSETDLDRKDNLSIDLNCNIWIKRDDLFPIVGGGTKGRKLKFILARALEHGCNAVVSAGSCESNHLRALAVMCAELGLKFTACIHDVEPKVFTGNLKILSLYATKLRFCKQDEIKQVMDEEIKQFLIDDFKPYYIYGGGHEVEGSLSLFKACELISKKLPNLDYIFVASGTGGTQAGIEVAVNNFLPNCKVIGVSVARDMDRGKKIVLQEISRLKDVYLSESKHSEDVVFDDQYLFGGYGLYDDEYLTIIMEDMRKYGIMLDPTYSGKAYYAMKDYIFKKRILSNSTILFWNTGGLLNLL